jgi:PKD repeat protein
VTVTVSGDGPTPSCTGTLNNGAGSCELTLNNVGDRTLTATYSAGNGFSPSSDTEAHTVTSGTPSNLSPTSEFTTTCDELDCRFEDQSNDPDGRIDGRLWNFGDGETSDRRNPDHEFPSGGTYQVSLTVTDNNGATATVTHAVTVSQSAASTNTRFEVDNPDPTVPGESFTVTLSVRSDHAVPEGTATVSDGVDGCPIQIIAGSGSCTLALNTLGQRTLTATFQGNASFATSSANETHSVNPPQAPNQPPTAEFTWQCDDLKCEFNNESTDSDGNIESRQWSFGDNSGSNNQNPDHDYAAGGTYTVRLSVTDNDNASAAVEHQVTVTAPNERPTAEFTSSCTNLDCQFSDQSFDSDGTIVSWSWDFDDGTGSTDQNPQHSFSSEDTYQVQLTVTDDRGGSRTVGHNVSVTAPPPPNQSPNAVDDAYPTPGGGAALTVDAPQGVLNNDSDPDGTPLSAQNASDPPQGSVQLNADGSFTYTPDLGAVGDDSFTYEASDGTLTSTGTVTITITP